MPPVLSGEPPKWGRKQQFQTVGSIHTHHTHNASGWVLEILANVAKWTKNIQSKFQVCSYYSFKVISILKPKFWICTKLPLFSDPATYYCGTHAGSTYTEWMKFHRKNYPARRDVRDYRLRGPTETTTDFHGLGLERTSVVAHEYHCISWIILFTL